MRWPLVILAVIVLLLALISVPPVHERFASLLGTPVPGFWGSGGGAAWSLAASSAGALWIYFYQSRRSLTPMQPPWLSVPARSWFGLRTVTDQLGAGVLGVARVVAGFDARYAALISGTSAAFWVWSSRAAVWVEDRVLDGAIRGLDEALGASARTLEAIQDGLLHRYYAWVIGGIGVMLLLVLVGARI